MDALKSNAMLKPDEAHRLMGTTAISRASFYAGLRRGEIPNRRVGRRILIPRHAFLRWLEATDQPAGAA